ncbi:MAG: phosphoesterase [Acidobacteria bacterium]|nr:phosphoesterase [Acidobacteriota bacterium]
MGVRVCFHDQCFDGACSAAVFARFYCECFNPAADLRYHGLTHRAGQLFESDIFDSEENVIVDFKYSSSDRLTWWFDHHQSAFLTEADAEHFRNDRSGKKFYDPDFKSCTKLIAHIATQQFGFRGPNLGELIHWADIIDGAQYPDPQTAVEMKHPAMQIALVIEGTRTKGFVADLIPHLTSKTLGEIAALPVIANAFKVLYAHHLSSVDLIGSRAQLGEGVLFFDLSDQDSEGFNKFIPYYLFPAAVYSVALSHSRERTKIAVGSNPWNPTPKSANLASICERFGGGGHAKVAAISLPPDDLETGRNVARQIVEELRGYAGR